MNLFVRFVVLFFLILFSLSFGYAADCNINANKRVLLVYATRAGSTQGVASALRKELCHSGLFVHMMDAKEIPDKMDMNSYQYIVLGSAIHMGHWLPEAHQFLEKNKEVLKTKSLAYFLVCMVLKDDTPENRKVAASYLEQERKILAPQIEAYFAGKSELRKGSFFSRLVGEITRKSEGDFRDWDAIHQWGKELALKFKTIK